MKKTFKGYYQPSQEEFAGLWGDCIFVLDTNVLLNLYRYSRETSDRLIKILRELSTRLWVPYQAAFEFHENRIVVIAKQANAYHEIEESIGSMLNKVKSDLGDYRKHPLIDTAKLIAEIEDFFRARCDELKDQSKGHPNLFEDDKLLIEITDLLEGKIGDAYSQEEVATLYREADVRFGKAIPPGYLDSKKDGEKKYGDYILWRQIIKKGQSDKKPIILVTDDSKDDWWRNFKGKTLGPRPELIAEMLKEASVDFYMYRTDQFMEYARSFLKQNVDQNAIDEVKEIGRRNKETQEQLLLKDKRESLTRVQHQLIEHLSILEQQQKVFKKSYHQLVEEESLSSVDMESIDGDTNFFYDLTNAKNKAKVFRVQRDELDTALNDVANQIRSIKHKIDAVNKDRAYIDMKLVYESNYQHDSNDRNGPACINCGSHGPWNGSICLVCNQKDDGDY